MQAQLFTNVSDMYWLEKSTNLNSLGPIQLWQKKNDSSVGIGLNKKI